MSSSRNNSNNKTDHHLSRPSSSIASGGGAAASVQSSSHSRRTHAEEEFDDRGSLVAPTRLPSNPKLLDITAEEEDDGMDAPALDDYQVPVGGATSTRRMSSASMDIRQLSNTTAIGIPEEDNEKKPERIKFNISHGLMEVKEPSETFVVSDAAAQSLRPLPSAASAAVSTRTTTTPEVSPTTNPKDSVRISLRNVGGTTTPRSPTTSAGARQKSARHSQSKAAAIAARNSARLSSSSGGNGGDSMMIQPGAVAVRNSTTTTTSAAAPTTTGNSASATPPPAGSGVGGGNNNVIRGDAEVKAAVRAAAPSGGAAATRPGAVAVRHDDNKPSTANTTTGEKSLAPARPAPSRLELAPPTEVPDSFMVDVEAAAMMAPTTLEEKESQYMMPSGGGATRGGNNNSRGAQQQQQNEIIVSRPPSQPGAVQSPFPRNSVSDSNNYDKSDDSLKISSSYDDNGHHHKAGSHGHHHIPSLAYDHADLPTAIEAHIVDEEKGSDPAKNGGGHHDENVVVAIGEQDSCWSFFKRSRSLQIGAFLGCFVIIGAVIGLVLTTFNKSITTEEPPPVEATEEEEPFFDQVGPFVDGPVKIGAEHGSSVSLSQDGMRMAVADIKDVYIYDLIELEAADNNEASGEDGSSIAYDWMWVATIEGSDASIVGQFSHSHDMVRTPVQVDLSQDGNFIAIGYPYANGANATSSSTGCVKVYRASDEIAGGDEGTLVVWQQLGDTMFGWSEADFFGTAVSLSASGGIVAVGAPGNDGHADIFTLNVDKWVKQGNFVGLDGTLEVGSVSMDANGQTFAVGGHPVSPTDDAAVVRVFRFVAGDWEELGDGIVGDLQDTAYIAELSADGNIVAVSNYYRGAAGPAEGGTNDALDVRAFEWDGRAKEWIQLGENLHAFAPGDKAGYFISLSDDGKLMAMGDPGREDKDGGGVTGHAHIYQYDAESDLWLQRKPNEYGESPGDQFGFAVALSGDGTHFAVGAPFNRGDGREKGRVYVYDIVL